MSDYGMFTKEQLYAPNNKKKSTCLLKETADSTDSPLFTVSEVRDDLLSLSKLFISLTLKDPTEVVFAETVFGSFAFWDNMRNAPKIKPYVEEWRLIADEKRKSLAFQALVKEVQEEGKGSLQAAKYLIEEPWKKEPKAKQQSKKTTEKSFTSVSSDVKRLKEQGLLQ